MITSTVKLESDIILKTNNLTKNFGGLVAVNKVSLEFERGSFTSLIGPNGSGKTTLFNLITGTFLPTSGRIVFNGIDITNYSLHKVAQMGISRSYQITNIFPFLTTFENIRLAIQRRGQKLTKLSSLLNRAGNYTEYHDEVLEIAKLTNIDPTKLYIPANLLPHAEKRKLELAMAVASKPQLLLLDEPAAGMSVEEIPEIYDTIIDIKQELGKELTIILVEHKMDMVMKFSEQVIVLSNGSVLAIGTPNEIQENVEVLSAYLGGLDNDYA